ncbi:MAG: hypothetical protein OEX18_07040 [Candidatus Krumholzibacteria bacterium]|nr:hypothetical protein [Candidatus Krumholzibacteria bacterium]MDH4337022.1 hypothetical protein [Candidatus Krumholzibacteria bacterium]MDH5268559.1 hypothetical protein [Candidatus Krumholzibacteria bacterium]
MSKRGLIGLGGLLVAALAMAGENPPAEGFDSAGSGARAVAIADRTMDAMGGRANWDAVQCIGWTIFGRTHLWNKWTGDYRLQSDTLLVIMNVNSGVGRAWNRGREMADDDDRVAVLQRARSIWINDSYWLIMPFKLKDTGVTLTYAGERATEDGRPADVLTLTFTDVGDTPHNRYEVYVDRETALVSQWSYFADAGDEKPRFTLPWNQWTDFGAIKISTGRGRTEVTGVRVSLDDEHAAFAGP